MNTDDLLTLTPSQLDAITEALLFAAAEPISVAQIASVIARTADVPVAEQEVRDALQRLNEMYRAVGRAFRIEEWAGGLRLATLQEFNAYVETLLVQERPRHLSKSLMESLAIVAYRQPVSKPELDFVRGVDSDYAVRKLLELGLLDVVGRGETLGRPLLYGTTQHFLDQFGLKSLDDLPKLREIEELLGDPEFSKERARLFFEKGLPDIDNLPPPLDGTES